MVDIEVLGEYVKAKDLDSHLRIVEVDGEQVLELRDYVPSLEEYGRGYWLPLSQGLVSNLLDDLSALLNRGLPK